MHSPFNGWLCGLLWSAKYVAFNSLHENDIVWVNTKKFKQILWMTTNISIKAFNVEHVLFSNSRYAQCLPLSSIDCNIYTCKCLYIWRREEKKLLFHWKKEPKIRSQGNYNLASIRHEHIIMQFIFSTTDDLSFPEISYGKRQSTKNKRQTYI